MEDQEISIASLALYVIKNKESSIKTILEIDGNILFKDCKLKSELLPSFAKISDKITNDTKDSIEITLNNFMTEIYNKKLIIYIAEFNQSYNEPF